MHVHPNPSNISLCLEIPLNCLAADVATQSTDWQIGSLAMHNTPNINPLHRGLTPVAGQGTRKRMIQLKDTKARASSAA